MAILLIPFFFSFIKRDRASAKQAASEARTLNLSALPRPVTSTWGSRPRRLTQLRLTAADKQVTLIDVKGPAGAMILALRSQHAFSLPLLLPPPFHPQPPRPPTDHSIRLLPTINSCGLPVSAQINPLSYCFEGRKKKEE